MTVLPSSAETVANIEELLKEILLRVPAETIIRFKCVSKHWLHLISDPSFCKSHTLQNPNFKSSAAGAAFIVRDKASKHYYFISPLGFRSKKPLNLTRRDDLHILDSSNGLLLCDFEIYFDSRSSLFVVNPTLYVVNPTTSQFIEIPIPVVDEITHFIADCLAVDPRKPNDYKVVRTELRKRLYIRIYSSQTRSWGSMIECFFTPSPKPGTIHKTLCCNNRIHWINISYEMYYYDLDDRSLGVVPQPSKFLYHSYEGDYWDEVSCFGESGGHLHLIMRVMPSFAQFDVMELERDYSSWFVRYKVNLQKMDCFGLDILFLAREENKTGRDDSCLFLGTSDKLISYNIRDRTSKTVIDKMEIYDRYKYGPCYYTKTLALV